MFLSEFSQPLTDLKGVGPKTARDLANLDIKTVSDLLNAYPRSYEDRQTEIPLAGFHKTGTVNTVIEVIGQEYFNWGRKKTLKVWVKDNSGHGTLLCYGRNFLAGLLQPGKRFFLYGQFSQRFGELQSASFEVEPWSDTPGSFCRVLPIYSLSGNLTQNSRRKAVSQALNQFGRYCRNELPGNLISNYHLLRKAEALQQIHFPHSMKHAGCAQKTLKYEELFQFQLIMQRQGILRAMQKRDSRTLNGSLAKELIKKLPFSLTPDQKSVFEEIKKDLCSTAPMYRLLQGDVGSGKTLVGFLSALLAIEAGEQAAFLAPTELLAEQHAEKAAQLLEPLGITLGLLTGSLDKKQRSELLKRIYNGEINLVIGTHALFSNEVRYSKLGQIIVDEQHRFGVEQRLSLVQKGAAPDLLLMSATPIPRTMALTAFSDLSISTIKTMPSGRKPIITHLARHGNEEKVYHYIRKELKNGRQAYFIYPLISQSDKLSLKDAETMYHHLKEIFPEFTLDLIHSKIPGEEKKQRMHRFNTGKTQLLVSTSVVEVGVDVPNATCMVIEHAERFGLAALHQLRGRVGRGDNQSYAFLLYTADLTDTAKQRLMVMKKSNDGFFIAEEDLKIRGHGDITGVDQSGFFRFKIADLLSDQKIVEITREDARRTITDDPGLLLPEHKEIRELFERCPPFSAELLTTG